MRWNLNMQPKKQHQVSEKESERELFNYSQFWFDFSRCSFIHPSCALVSAKPKRIWQCVSYDNFFYLTSSHRLCHRTISRFHLSTIHSLNSTLLTLPATSLALSLFLVVSGSWMKISRDGSVEQMSKQTTVRKLIRSKWRCRRRRRHCRQTKKERKLRMKRNWITCSKEVGTKTVKMKNTVSLCVGSIFLLLVIRYSLLTLFAGIVAAIVVVVSTVKRCCCSCRHCV